MVFELRGNVLCFIYIPVTCLLPGPLVADLIILNSLFELSKDVCLVGRLNEQAVERDNGGSGGKNYKCRDYQCGGCPALYACRIIPFALTLIQGFLVDRDEY